MTSDSPLESLLMQLTEVSQTALLGEIAGGVVHDLNQPLGAIATFSQAGMRMLDRPEPMTSRALDVFKQINDEALSASERIQAIRRLFDQSDLVRSRCRMEDLIVELLPVLELISERCHGRVEFNPGPASPTVDVDRRKIQHVLYSLVLNALEAAPGISSPLVRILVTSDRYGVETHVIDGGPGIPPESQQRLFKPFYTTKPRGAGLGLASSHSIVESHEGSIGFENLRGGGCRFWFRLPVPSG